MPTLTGTGCLSTPLTTFADMLSEMSSWQSWCGVSTAADARERIHLVRVKDPENVQRPFILLDWQPGQTFRQSGYSMGSLMMLIEDSIPEDYRNDNSDPAVYILNNVGALTAEIWSDTEDYSQVRLSLDKQDGLVMETPLKFSDPQEGEFYGQIIYTVNFGVTSN